MLKITDGKQRTAHGKLQILEDGWNGCVLGVREGQGRRK